MNCQGKPRHQFDVGDMREGGFNLEQAIPSGRPYQALAPVRAVPPAAKRREAKLSEASAATLGLALAAWRPTTALDANPT